MGRNGMIATALSAVLLLAGSAGALTPAQKCQSGKLKVAGKYDFCRLKAEAKAAQTASTPDFTKCDPKFTDKWASTELAGGGQCPSNGDATAIQAFIVQHTDALAAALAGGPRFVDNANGTISDNQSGLQWEKKVKLDGVTDFANLADADNTYKWAGTCSILTSKYCQPTAAAATLCAANTEGGITGCATCGGGEGTCNATDTAWTQAVARNTASFASHSDWRVPKRAELVSIVDYNDLTSSPVTDVAFQGASCGGACTDITNAACSCTRSSIYWSASSLAPSPTSAWLVAFLTGGTGDGGMTLSSSVRLVRGGS